MSAPLHEPLRVAPASEENHVQMAWLLQVRRAARTALDAALAVPRKAAEYVGRLVHKLHLDSAVSWLRRTAARLAQPLQAASAVLGRTGLLAAATGVFTSPTGRAALSSVGRLPGKLIGWAARTTYSGIDRVTYRPGP
jgi:alkylated DNA nucleotide flippase Atl1